MNRRKFFKLLGFGALASVVPIPKSEAKTYIGVDLAKRVTDSTFVPVKMVYGRIKLTQQDIDKAHYDTHIEMVKELRKYRWWKNFGSKGASSLEQEKDMLMNDFIAIDPATKKGDCTGIVKGRYNPETHEILVDSFEHIETPGIDIFMRR